MLNIRLKTFCTTALGIMLLASLAAAALLAVGASASSREAAVKTENKKFIDSLGRTMIYRGQNAVFKIAPWLPSSEGFDTTTTLSKIDARHLKDWGFNVVRLGVMWPGLEPGAQGDYSDQYLNEVDVIVQHLKAHDISVVLDLHQDLFSRDYCGEGVPSYVVNTCKKYYDAAGRAPFPSPLKTDNTTAMTLDADGYPDIDWCLETAFFKYYLTEEVSFMFQCLYDDKDGLWDALGGYWKKVATRFAASPNVLGYELINEPWLGDVFTDKSLLLPKQTEARFLQPMYAHVAEKIREADDEKIIFFEGVTIDYWPSGFTSVPGGPEYASRSAIAYHIYCPLSEPSIGEELACRTIDREFMEMRQKDAERLSTGLILTEFGAMQDETSDMQEMEKLMQMADEFQASWMYWQFKQYEDLTTCTPEGESMYSGEGGSLSQRKLRVLSRTYPQATSGVLHSFAFNSRTSNFSMNYTPLLPSEIDQKEPRMAKTHLYFNRNEHYRNGIRLKVGTDNGDGTTTEVPHWAEGEEEGNNNNVGDLTVSVLEVWRCDDNHLDIIYTGNVKSTLVVTLEPCGDTKRPNDPHCKCQDRNNDDGHHGEDDDADEE